MTVWHWLTEDAIKPWQRRSWIFPRDRHFAAKAGPILDLYAAVWQGERLHPGDDVVCADERPSIQARKRTAATRPARRGEGQKVEHEYDRMGALCYLAAWDARRAKIFDGCAPNRRHRTVRRARRAVHEPSPIQPGAAHVPDHRQWFRAPRQTLDRPPPSAWPNLIVVHTPIHASWLNQAEIYFWVVQRKVVSPNDFADLDTLEHHLLAFGRHYERRAAASYADSSLGVRRASAMRMSAPISPLRIELARIATFARSIVAGSS